jgi:hypothetical protein
VIFAVPDPVPVTTVGVPVGADVATALLLLVQLPPGVAFVHEVVPPMQSDVTPPVIGPGVTFTVTTLIAVQVPIAYVMLTVPAVAPITPPTMPVVVFTVALAVLLLLQVPPVTVLVRAIVLPVHTEAIVGAIAAGLVLTVTVFVAKQPVAVTMYDILAVPTPTPVTVVGDPAAITVATAVLLELQVPPGVVFVKAAVLPIHSIVAGIGLITFGAGLTVTITEVVHPVPKE